MRVLFAYLPEKSHVYTMVPLAWALMAAGHEVLMANAPSLTREITGAGLVAAPVGSDHDLHSEMVIARDSQDADVANWSRLGYGDVDHAALVARYEISVPYGFARYNDPVLDDLVALARHWKPDLVVRDPIAYSRRRRGPRLRRRPRPPAVVRRRLRPRPRHLRRTRPGHARGTAHGPPRRLDRRTGPPLRRALRRGASQRTVHHRHPAAQPAPVRRPAHRLHALRPVQRARRAGELAARGTEAPRICVTLGRTNTEAYGGDYVDVAGILRSLSRLDAEIVAALLPEQTEGLGELPDNVRAVSGVALNTLLPGCSAVVHHGGWGTFSTALVNAVPQLAVSTLVADQELRGRSLEEAGAGFFLHHSEGDPDRVADLTRRLLEDPSHAAAARRLRDESAAMPSPHDIVPELADLAARG